MSVEMDTIIETLKEIERQIGLFCDELHATEQRILELRHAVASLEAKRDILCDLKSTIEARDGRLREALKEREASSVPLPEPNDRRLGATGFDARVGEGDQCVVDTSALVDILSRLVKTELPRDGHGQCTLASDDIEGFAYGLLEKVASGACAEPHDRV